MTISKRQLSSVVGSLREFLKFYDKDSECLQVSLPKPKNEVRSTKSKDNLFAHYYNDINEHPKRQIRLSFRFRNKKYCVFSIEKFEPHDIHFILTDFVNVKYREIHHLLTNL